MDNEFDVLRLAEECSEELFERMNGRGQQGRMVEGELAPEQWLADEVHGLLLEYENPLYSRYDTLQYSKKILKDAENGIFPDFVAEFETEGYLGFAKDALIEQQRLVTLEERLAKMGYRGNSSFYKISYDALFIAPGKKIEYKGEVYEADVALYFEYSFFDEKGNEVFLIHPDSQPRTGIKFYIDRENGYRAEYQGSDGNPPKFVPDGAYIWRDCQTPVTIPFEDGVRLLLENFEIFDNGDNKPVQSTSYSTRKIAL